MITTTIFLLNIYDAICRSLGFYDRHGLKHSDEHLDAIRDKFALYPVKKQAKYVDAVIYNRYEHDAHFRKFQNDLILNQYNDLTNDKFDFEFYSTTYYGNLAYMHLHTNNVQVKNAAYAILQAYAVYTRQKLNK